MAVSRGSIRHEDRLNVVDHLEELRGRLIVSLAALAVAFGFCMWQNHALLQHHQQAAVAPDPEAGQAGNGPLGATYTVQQSARTVADAAAGRRRRARASRQRRIAGHPRVAAGRHAAAAQGDQAPVGAGQGNKPVTLGIGEPFTTTIGVALIFALHPRAADHPVSSCTASCCRRSAPSSRRITTSLMLSIPLLFVAGVMFGYFVVLPAAVRFFQNFNSEQFNVLVQANQYYHFAAVTLLAMGLVFQVPVGILAATRAGIVTPHQLRHNRRYAILACGAVAAFLPGDVITLVLETVPLYLLFEVSVLVACSWRERRRERRLATPGVPAHPGTEPRR